VCHPISMVHLVWDNYATHKTKLIRDWLIQRPRWQVHLTPTSSSWLNQVERFFASLTENRSAAAFTAASRSCKLPFKADPRRKENSPCLCGLWMHCGGLVKRQRFALTSKTCQTVHGERLSCRSVLNAATMVISGWSRHVSNTWRRSPSIRDVSMTFKFNLAARYP
jgi:DDE superfamily endonuclease